MEYLPLIQKRILAICCSAVFATGIVFGVTTSSHGLETRKMKAPLDVGAEVDRTQPDNERFSPLTHVMLESVRFFQQWISPIDGSRCNFSPTCSRYGYDAVNHYGPFLGTVMTADRLMRCSYLTETEPIYNRLHNGKFHDPVDSSLLPNP
jgi:putative membrane protein insertion efficiency factor